MKYQAEAATILLKNVTAMYKLTKLIFTAQSEIQRRIRRFFKALAYAETYLKAEWIRVQTRRQIITQQIIEISENSK